MRNASTPSTAAQSKRTDLQQQVTDTIIRQLEAGTVPWHQPWKGDNSRLPALPKNFTTNKRYNGINILLLWGSAIENDYSTSEWATFKQWSEKKELIRKGEKGSLVVYYDTIEKEVDGEVKEIPFLKSSYVFNRCQLANYTLSKIEMAKPEQLIAPIERVDRFIQNTKAIIEHGGSRACYVPHADLVRMPMTDSFESSETCTSIEHYYSTLFHEMVHWTGNPKRLNRTKGKKFGDQDYAVEELVAELGAAFLSAELAINPVGKADHASYIAGWLKLLKDNKKHIFTAASEASKACDYLNDLQKVTCTLE